jgi:hypothetical protein
MKLKELVDQFNDKEILKRLFELYPDQKKSKGGYIKALIELRHKRVRPVKDNMQIVLTRRKENKEKWVSVDGDNGTNQNWALDFTRWGDWLGMEFDKKTIQRKFPKLDMLVHCLWEMTWEGYSDKQVIYRWGVLAGRVKEMDEQIKKEKAH